MARMVNGLFRYGRQLRFADQILVALLITGAFWFLAASPVQALMVTGSYTGNGTDNRAITGVKFQPDVVIIKSSDSAQEAVMRTSSMSGDNSKPMGGATALTANLIQSLDADGFTIGNDARINTNGITYYWNAFKVDAGQMKVSSYTGTGVDNRNITGVGFKPDYVIVISAEGKEPVHRSSAMSGDTTLYFKNAAAIANLIQALQTDGFQLGNDDNVNKSGVTYHYIAWKQVAGKMAVGSYAGNNVDNRNISTLTFKPEYMIIKVGGKDNFEAVHRPVTLSGDNTLKFIAAVQVADNIQELRADGFQVGTSDRVNKTGKTYYWVAFAGPYPTISSAANQAFYMGGATAAISPITVTDHALTAQITAANDIRIRIPAGFNMTWDTTDTTAAISGGAASKVSTTVSYEDSGKTLVLNVTTNFSAGDQIIVSGLSFTNFTAPSGNDNLELEVYNDNAVTSYDDKRITVLSGSRMRTGRYTGNGTDNRSITGLGFQPNLVIIKASNNTTEAVIRTSSMSGDLSKPMGAATVLTANLIQSLDADGFTIGTDDRVNESPHEYEWIAFKAGTGELKVDSYSGTGVDNRSITGIGFQPDYVIVMSAEAKEPVHRSSAQAGDTTLFFKAATSAANLIQALETDGFQVGNDDNVNKTGVTYHYVAWKAVIAKTAVGTYAGDSTDDRSIIGLGFEPEYVIIKQTTAIEAVHRPATLSQDNTLKFINQVQAADMIQALETDGFQVGTSDRVNTTGGTYFWVAFAGGELKISSAIDQVFRVGASPTAISTITITEHAFVPTITAAKDIRIRIPAGFNMAWDTSVTTALIGGSAAAKVSTTASYEDSGKTLVLNVETDFQGGDRITISGLSFMGFTAVSAQDNLELEVLNDDTVQATDDKTITITDLSISSASTQEFIVGDAATAISTITITDSTGTPLITAENDIRIRIPSTFYMTWDTSDTTAVIGGGASAKVSTTASYEDSGKTLVLDVTTDFAASDSITISGLSFANFTAASYGDRLEMVVFNDGITTDEDDKWKAIGGAPASGSMLAYGEGTVITPRFRTWDGSTFSAEGSANDTDDTIKWVVLKASPVSVEMILGVYSSATKYLFVQTWNGTSWTSNWSSFLNYDGSKRVFDIAYEKTTGDVVVVFGNNDTNTLCYRKRVGGVWDSADQTISTITPDTELLWVRAKSRPTNNDIFVAGSSNSKTLYALRWDGDTDTWTDGLTTTAGIKDQNREGFDLAFESASGDAFLIWGDAALNVKYREFTTSWQSESTAYSGLTDDVFWLKAAYDPLSTSSNIAIAMLREDTYLEFGAWNGSSWVTRPSAILALQRDNRSIDVAFEYGTGEAVYAFSQSANSTQLARRTWTSAGGFSSVTVETGTTGNIKFVQLKADPTSASMMAVYADANADLFYRYWDGSSFSTLGTALETTISDADKLEPFMFAWKASPPTAIDLLSLTARGENGSVLVSWSTAQEIDNFGFHVYRSESVGGLYTRITDRLIPGLTFSVRGRDYNYVDSNVTRGRLYYYKLEDIDFDGTRTMHGPVCVDWDGDGMPDDWEIKLLD